MRWHADEVVTTGPFRPRDGMLPVPDGFGLEVELDAAALRRCHERYREEGPYDEFAHPSRPGRYAAI
jgi:L-alanine-DL-glutamate epimerase-like enolase superfamily enzyme